MLLAITAFLVHGLLVPQNVSLAVASEPASVTRKNVEEDRPPAGAPEAAAAAHDSPDPQGSVELAGTASASAWNLMSAESETRDRDSRPVSAMFTVDAPFIPGRLVPERAPAITHAAAEWTSLYSTYSAINAQEFIRDEQPAAESMSREIRGEQFREQHLERRRQEEWMALSAAQHGAAGFDAWATRRAVSEGYRELNPMLRPFAGNASIYVAIQAGPAVLDYVGWRMMSSRHTWMRSTWWIPQGVGTALSLVSGMHDIGLPNPLATQKP